MKQALQEIAATGFRQLAPCGSANEDDENHCQYR